MRCRACNFKIKAEWVVHEEGCAPMLEDLCQRCKYIVRASNYDGGPDNELDNIFISFGIWYERENPEE